MRWHGRQVENMAYRSYKRNYRDTLRIRAHDRRLTI
jgi:hypothetical protein